MQQYLILSVMIGPVSVQHLTWTHLPVFSQIVCVHIVLGHGSEETFKEQFEGLNGV